MVRAWLLSRNSENRTENAAVAPTSDVAASETGAVVVAASVFRWRGDSVSRIEGFSDAAFGFALALLVAAANAPRNFAELKDAVVGFPAFLLAFAMLTSLWQTHYLYFRRYGLNDSVVMRLNLCLLAFVLFSVYPLKFLSTIVSAMYFHLLPANADKKMLMYSQFPQLMLIYALGLAAIFFIFGLLYLHAYNQRIVLSLSPMEIAATRMKIVAHFAVTLVALASAAISLDNVPAHSLWASLIYLLIIPVNLGERGVSRILHRRYS